MKKNMAIVATALMLGTTMGTAQANQPVDGAEKGERMSHHHHGKKMMNEGGDFSKHDVRDGKMTPEEGAVKQVERINSDAGLELTDAQKAELASKMVSFQKAQVSLHKQFEQDNENLRETFEKELNSVLDEDQVSTLKEFNEEREAERAERKKEMIEKFKKNFQEKRAEKIKNGEVTEEDLKKSPSQRIDK